MQVKQVVLQAGQGLEALAPLQAMAPDVVWVFGDLAWLRQAHLWAQWQQQLGPRTLLLGCTTAGEIAGTHCSLDTCVVTAVKWASTQAKLITQVVANAADSWRAGEALGRQLKSSQLSAVLLYAPGVDVNGVALTAGVQAGLGRDVPVVGGLAGDSGLFSGSLQMASGEVADRMVVALGLHGASLKCGVGSYGGWLPYGVTMSATGVDEHVLREIDGRPALAVYKELLGPLARALPQAGLLFPFEVLPPQAKGPVSSNNNSVIRTILGVDEAQQSLLLAGAVEPNSRLRLMQSSQNRLVNGATLAASSAYEQWVKQLGGAANAVSPDSALAIMVSCIGRRMVLDEHVDDELRAVSNALRNGATMTGFYSNGEIAPSHKGGDCLLHNQTMTLMVLSEQ